MKSMLMIATAVVALGGTAFAADIPLKAPPGAAPALSWSGIYVGVQGGANYVTTQSVWEPTGEAITDKYHPVGLLFGGTAGLNWQIGRNIVIGAEGDWSWTNARDSAHDIPPFNTAFFETFRENWIATYRGRLGFTFGANNNWMIYGTGGGASANVKIAVHSPSVQISESRTLSGWTAGGGVETLLGPNWSMKSEVLFVRLDDKAYFTPAPNSLFLSNRVVQTDQLIARVGVNYRFGPMGW